MCLLSLLLAALLGTTAQGAGRSGGNYSVSVEILDAGGGTASSASYSQSVTTIGGIQGNHASAGAGQAAGFAGQVTDGLAYQFLSEIAVESPAGASHDIPSGGSRNFGPVGVGIGADLVFAVRNYGFANLTLTGSPARVILGGADAAQFRIITQPAQALAPGGGTTFSVRFTPVSVGVKSATLTIPNTDADEGSFTIALTGTGEGGEIDLEQPVGSGLASGGNRSFGPTALGTSGVLAFRITNSGIGPLALTGSPLVALSGTHAADFALLSQPGGVIPPGGSSDFSVRFAPGGAGLRTATLSIANNDITGAESPYVVTLTGTGEVGEIDLEQPSGSGLASGGSRSFGTATLGTSGVLAFRITNSGIGPLALTGSPLVDISGTHAADFVLLSQPSGVIPAGGSSDFSVRFAPGSTGLRTATLTIANNDITGAESPYVVTLTGTGAADSLIATFGSPGAVTGGQLNGTTFTIGVQGTANPGNNWPAAESPAQATDGNPATKFLNFQNQGAGLLLTPADSSIAYNRLALTTANDAIERDPASYRIYGSATALPASGSFSVGGLTLIQEGTLALHTDRGIGPHVVQFSNATAYASYLVVFPTVRSTSGNNLTQIAEVQLSRGLSVPYQVPVGKARGGQLVGNSFNLGAIGAVYPGTNWSAGQSPDAAINGGVSDKYLLFRNTGTGLIVAPEAGPAVINSLSLWTANDFPERDPVTYQVYGSSSSALGYSGSHNVGVAPWTLLQDTASVTLPATRDSGPTTVTFANSTAYTSYLVVFPAVKNSPTASTITQIGEIAFANVPSATAPLVASPYSADLTVTTATLGGTVTGSGGAALTERGLVYSLTSVNSNPLINGGGVTKVTASGTVGVFALSVAGLAPGSGYSYKAYAINSAGTTYSAVATFTTPTPPNSAPTDLDLTPASIAENNAANATVGTLGALDADAGQTHTFSLVGGAGATDNASFTIAGNVLRLVPVADFESKPFYNLRLRADDGHGGYLEKALTVTVINVAENATDNLRLAYFGTPDNSGNTADDADFDGDGISNIMEIALGTNPASSSSGSSGLQFTGTFAGGGTVAGTGQPIALFENIATGADYRGLFSRRKNFAALGVTLIPQFSNDLITWENSTDTPTVLADDGEFQIVSVPFTRILSNGKKARYFRLGVSTN